VSGKSYLFILFYLRTPSGAFGLAPPVFLGATLAAAGGYMGALF